MAFETNTLVNGEWTTRTLDVNMVLQHYNQQDIEQDGTALHIDDPPTIGLLTQTVVRSPMVHWILPAKLRTPDLNDVAFIGEDFVQIKELRGDGFLWDLVRREDFGARIRNARIVGSTEEYENDIEVLGLRARIKPEDGNAKMENCGTVPSSTQDPVVLPPQYLVLQLDTGDSIFLMLQQSLHGKLEFIITTRHRVSKAMLHIQPGMHVSVDPTSRYMAVACSEASFAIYELSTRKQLKAQYSNSGKHKHVLADTFFPFNGVIHKMEFLFPSPEDEDYVVLLVLVIIKGKTRMLLYEWKAGDDIRKIRSARYHGYALEQAHQMPLLLIPLKFKSTFILVFEKQMVLYRNILQGLPECEEVYNRVDPPTALHHGSGAPLWAGWARPTNRMEYHDAHRDDIYIAREDGLLKFLEIDSKVDRYVDGDMHVGDFDGRCGTALACIDYRDYTNTTGDLLITGGDSCTGGTYLVEGRATPLFKQPIDNWTPAQDLVTAPVHKEKQHSEGQQSHIGIYGLPTPHRIFSCVGKGAKGAIVEFRYGVEARIGLLLDYELPIVEAWAVPSSICDVGDGDASLFLLSFVQSSVVICLSSDESSVEALDNDATRLDTRYRTISLYTKGGTVVQVTEHSIVIICGNHRHLYENDQLLQIYDAGGSSGHGTQIHDVVTNGLQIIYTSFIGNIVCLTLLDIDFGRNLDSGAPSLSEERQVPQKLNTFSTQVTSLALCQIDCVAFVIVAEWIDNSPFLSFQPINEEGDTFRLNVSASDAGSLEVEALVSIVVVKELSTCLTLLCGTRNGLILTIELSKYPISMCHRETHRIGATSVKLTSDYSTNIGTRFFASCDSKAYTVSIMDFKHLGCLHINRIWLTDALNPGLSQPELGSVVGYTSIHRSELGQRLMFVAGSQLLLAFLLNEVKPIPRRIEIGGTPSRMVYSKELDVLIVAASVNDRSTILFIDPVTGINLSAPIEHQGGQSKDFVSGLGHVGERILRLFEWSYIKDARTWNFIIASTSTGRVLIISIQDQDRVREESDMLRSRFIGLETVPERSSIAYYTRHKFKSAEPVYSVTGFPDGLLWCSGEKLFCDILDLGEKRFRRVAEYELPSLANNLTYKDGTIYALTQEHSLEVLQLCQSNSGTYEISRKYGDQLSRYALHHIPMEHPSNILVHLISDKLRSVVGLWPTQDTKADTLETLFEGQLLKSILRFQTTSCRPLWDPVWNATLQQTGRSIAAGSVTLNEVLGLSIDGSLTRFTLLAPPAWEFLRYLINLCLPSLNDSNACFQDDVVPCGVSTRPKRMMHVDGDLLKCCLDDRRLEELLQIGSATPTARQTYSKFCELLQTLHPDIKAEDSSPEIYLEQAYTDLAMYLRPTL